MTERNSSLVTVRLPTEERVALERAANRERRSLAGYVRCVLGDHLAATGAIPGKATADTVEAR